MGIFIFIGVALIIIGICLNILVSRRKFYRRNVAGLEAYKSFSSAILNRLLNTFLRLLGIAMILFGIGLIGITQKKESRTELEKMIHPNQAKEVTNKKE